MNAFPLCTTTEPWWRTYLKAAIFSAPSMILWAVSVVFFFPKLKQIWADAGVNLQADSLLRISYFMLKISEGLVEHIISFLVSFVLLLLFLEFRSNHWPRYRRASFGAAAFLINTAVLILMTVMFLSMLLTAPLLTNLK